MGDATGIWQVETRAAQGKQHPTTKNYLAPNISIAHTEKPHSRCYILNKRAEPKFFALDFDNHYTESVNELTFPMS